MRITYEQLLREEKGKELRLTVARASTTVRLTRKHCMRIREFLDQQVPGTGVIVRHRGRERGVILWLAGLGVLETTEHDYLPVSECTIPRATLASLDS